MAMMILRCAIFATDSTSVDSRILVAALRIHLSGSLKTKGRLELVITMFMDGAVGVKRLLWAGAIEA
jgi:hypothetical protein